MTKKLQVFLFLTDINIVAVFLGVFMLEQRKK